MTPLQKSQNRKKECRKAAAKTGSEIALFRDMFGFQFRTPFWFVFWRIAGARFEPGEAKVELGKTQVELGEAKVVPE